MDLQEMQLKFEVDRIQLFLEKLEDAEIEWFWQAIRTIHDVFPNLDIYHAGSGKYGYLGFGIKPILTNRVKEFLLVSHLGNNEDGKFCFKLEVIQALADFIFEQDPQFSLNFSFKNLTHENFLDWLHNLREYAIQFGMALNGQGLLPLDYQNQNLTAAQAVEYLKERYPGTDSGTVHIAAFKTSLGRELALDPKLKTPIIICNAEPPIELKLPIKQSYSENDTRNQHLSTHAKSLMLGNKAYSIIVSNLDDLEKFCDWYEQNGDQTTALEKKVQQFLKLWPIESLNNLSIEDYHQAKNTNCFIAQIDSFDPTQGDPTFANYFDIWEPINLGKDDKYYNEKPYSWHKRLGDSAELAFEALKQEILNIVEAVQRRDLNAIDQIQFPKGLKWMIAFLYQDFNDPCIIPIVSKVNTKRIGYDHLYPKLPLPEFLSILLEDRGEQAFFPYVEKLFAMIRKGYLDNKQKKKQTQELLDDVMTQQPLNRILFGAAGTGKTFHSINHALSIIENKPLEVLEQEDRTALKTRFDQYKEQGQIKFVTFHQSFSYEDFVEGIRAETDDKGQLTYDVQSGVFKALCDIAFNQNFPHSNIDEVITNFCNEIAEQPLQLKTKTGLTYEITYEGGKTLKCFLLESVNKGTYSLSLDTIKKLLNGVRLETYGMPSYIKPIVSLLSDKIKFSEEKQDVEHKPYILIIDEINRGNISRIFGELITLIEDSKRQGAEEELSVTLPYSKEEFSVPSNVYIIGTMNSSDRSLTGLDIALRRRFTFIEMPPKPELLNDIEVKELNIGEILKVINQRIEVLLDRDHCIGHANFMSLKKQPTLEHLASIFKQKIIPQLQEYFFDDWAKINMVLNANGMLKPKPVERSVLFPNVESDSDAFFEEQKTWQLNDTAFDSIASFIKIIKH
nr:AAA family ATPase [Acinetobacter variabilis]